MAALSQLQQLRMLVLGWSVPCCQLASLSRLPHLEVLGFDASGHLLGAHQGMQLPAIHTVGDT